MFCTQRHAPQTLLSCAAWVGRYIPRVCQIIIAHPPLLSTPSAHLLIQCRCMLWASRVHRWGALHAWCARGKRFGGTPKTQHRLCLSTYVSSRRLVPALQLCARRCRGCCGASGMCARRVQRAWRVFWCSQHTIEKHSRKKCSLLSRAQCPCVRRHAESVPAKDGERGMRAACVASVLVNQNMCFLSLSPRNMVIFSPPLFFAPQHSSTPPHSWRARWTLCASTLVPPTHSEHKHRTATKNLQVQKNGGRLVAQTPCVEEKRSKFTRQSPLNGPRLCCWYSLVMRCAGGRGSSSLSSLSSLVWRVARVYVHSRG